MFILVLLFGYLLAVRFSVEAYNPASDGREHYKEARPEEAETKGISARGEFRCARVRSLEVTRMLPSCRVHRAFRRADFERGAWTSDVRFVKGDVS